VVDARAGAVGEIARAYEAYPHIGAVLPALGYNAGQLRDLQATIAATDADVVVMATPCDLAALIDIPKPVVRARYEYIETEQPSLADSVNEFLDQLGTASR